MTTMLTADEFKAMVDGCEGDCKLRSMGTQYTGGHAMDYYTKDGEHRSEQVPFTSFHQFLCQTCGKPLMHRSET